jgi:hypothetical protein
VRCLHKMMVSYPLVCRMRKEGARLAVSCVPQCASYRGCRQQAATTESHKICFVCCLGFVSACMCTSPSAPLFQLMSASTLKLDVGSCQVLCACSGLLRALSIAGCCAAGTMLHSSWLPQTPAVLCCICSIPHFEHVACCCGAFAAPSIGL